MPLACADLLQVELDPLSGWMQGPYDRIPSRYQVFISRTGYADLRSL